MIINSALLLIQIFYFIFSFAVVAGIEPEWFPLILPNMCTFSKPEEEPAPRYDSQKGKVLCHMGGTFGQLQKYI